MLDILGNQAPMQIIELFCNDPEAVFFSREIGVKLELSKATTIKWLKRLTEEGILTESAVGRRKFYRLQWGHPIARQVRVLFTLGELTPALRGLKELRGVYLVGTAATGTGAHDSPIELLILTRGGESYVKSAFEKVSKKLKRPIKTRVMDPLEYSALEKKDPELFARLEREKIRLSGAEVER